MTIQQNELSNKRVYNTLLTIWGGIFISQFAILAVIYFIDPKLFEFDPAKPFLDKNALITVVFAMAALSNLAISFVLRNKFLTKAVEEKNISLVQTAVIASLVFCTTISLFGFMLALIISYQYFFLWIALGMLGILLHFPLRKHVMTVGSGE